MTTNANNHNSHSATAVTLSRRENEDSSAISGGEKQSTSSGVGASLTSSAMGRSVVPTTPPTASRGLPGFLRRSLRNPQPSSIVDSIGISHSAESHTSVAATATAVNAVLAEDKFYGVSEHDDKGSRTSKSSFGLPIIPFPSKQSSDESDFELRSNMVKSQKLPMQGSTLEGKGTSSRLGKESGLDGERDLTDTNSNGNNERATVEKQQTGRGENLMPRQASSSSSGATADQSLPAPSMPKASSFDDQERPQHRKSYKELTFEKTILAPVVNVQDLRKLAWNGIPVCS